MARCRLLLLLAVAGLAAGCSGSGYTYHSNQAENLYFKVPDAWTVFDTQDLGDGAEPPPGLWVRGFVAGRTATIEGVFQVTSGEPRGYVLVETLDVMERDAVSLAMLRGTHFGADESTGEPIDPLVYAQEHPDELQILGYDDTIVLDHGPHGVHLRVAMTSPETGTAIIDQTVLVDALTSKRYVLSIGCSVECFDQHERQIEEVIESWTLEAT